MRYNFKKTIILLVLLFIYYPHQALARECRLSEKVEIKRTAQNVKITLEKNIDDSFNLLIDNIHPNVYVTVDGFKNAYYNSSKDKLDTVEIKNLSANKKLKVSVYSNVRDCKMRQALMVRYANVPAINPYYKEEICQKEKFKENKYCRKWINIKLSKEEFYKNLKKKEYQQNLDEINHKNISMFEFLSKNFYYIIIILLSIVAATAITIIKRNDKYKF